MSQTTRRTRWSSAFSTPINAPTVLLVDDDRVVRSMIESMLGKQGYRIMTANNGEECLAVLARHAERIDAVLLDREMEGISGMQVVSQMKANPRFSTIPIVMVTGSDGQENIQQGIAAGVYYYLVKPVDDELLKTVIGAALRERSQKQVLLSELDRHGGALKAIRGCQMSLKTLQEAEDVACFIAGCFPDPQQAVTGLMELLINAIEHGNLGISYEEKSELLANERWHDEVEHRLRLPENASKSVNVLFQRKEGHCLVQITDQGEGFDWKRYWHINPARASASNGRGITCARLMAFERMAYNDKGNSVTVMVSEAAAQQKDYAW